ncbi:hypothetical protein MycrhDRAFT_6503 [Mycolicibacterium rhodesiae JS60]|nr:hypothetical protein MycrhDRAFT_6503 [Mycolicibacterium rhodesiae JS60]
MKRIDVDFNMIVYGDMVLADPDFASEELQLGDWVEAVDFADPDMRFTGQVADFDDAGMAYLRINWSEPLAEDPVIQVNRVSAPATQGIGVRNEGQVTFGNNRSAPPWGFDVSHLPKTG